MGVICKIIFRIKKVIGFNSSVFTIELQTDGKILIGGNFTSYRGITSNRIIRLNSDETSDGAFVQGGGFNNDVEDIQIQTDDKILISGKFTDYNGTSANRIIRLNTNGTVDGGFVYGTGFDNTVDSMILQSDGKIVVGGNFTDYNGTSANRIIRLNTDGTVDSGFVYGTGFDSTVATIHIQADNKILISGNFADYNGTLADRIIRLNTNGTVDGGFVYGTGLNILAQAIITQIDNKIILSGLFTDYNGTSANRIIRLNTNGTVDGGFVYGTGFNNSSRSILLQSDGKIVVGGFFTDYNGTSANRIIRLNTDGTVDGGFVYGTGVNGNVQSLEIQTDNKILVGGFFTDYNGTKANNFIRLNSDGTVDN